MSAAEQETVMPPVELPMDRMWGVAQVAAYLGRSVSWVYKRTAAGEIPTHREAGGVRFAPEEIAAWVRGQKAGKLLRLPAK